MTPRRLDVAVVQARLELMTALLDDLSRIGTVSAERLAEDRLLKHAVERILTQLVDLAVSVNGHVVVAVTRRHPSDYRESFTLAAEVGAVGQELAKALRLSVGLRNVLIHEYVRVDLEAVAASIPAALTGYGEYVRSVAQFVSTFEDPG